MATKTITLELDAYEHLQRAKRGKESFSSVVRRARFDPEESTGAGILGAMSAIYRAGKGGDAKVLEYWDADAEASGPRISPSKWESARSSTLAF